MGQKFFVLFVVVLLFSFSFKRWFIECNSTPKNEIQNDEGKETIKNANKNKSNKILCDARRQQQKEDNKMNWMPCFTLKTLILSHSFILLWVFMVVKCTSKRKVYACLNVEQILMDCVYVRLCVCTRLFALQHTTNALGCIIVCVSWICWTEH